MRGKVRGGLRRENPSLASELETVQHSAPHVSHVTAVRLLVPGPRFCGRASEGREDIGCSPLHPNP